MRIVKALGPGILCFIFIAIALTVARQRDITIQKYQATQVTIEQRDIVIDSLETMCQYQAVEIEHWIRENQGLAEDIDGLNINIEAYQAYNDSLEGRIRKMAGVYQIREQVLLDEIERLEQDCHQEPIEPAPIPGCR